MIAPMSAITAMPRKGAIAEARTVSKSVQEDVREGLSHIEGSVERLIRKTGLGDHRTAPVLSAQHLLDVRSGKLLWLLPGRRGEPAQLAKEVDLVLERPKRSTNAVKSAYRVPIEDLRGRIIGGQARVLWGSVE
jgi:hypothetical protein